MFHKKNCKYSYLNTLDGLHWAVRAFRDPLKQSNFSLKLGKTFKTTLLGLDFHNKYFGIQSVYIHVHPFE